MNRSTIVFFILVFFFSYLPAQQNAILNVGNPDFSDWKGMSSVKNGIGVLAVNQPIRYRYPDGKIVHKGFREINNNVSDWSKFAGIRFELYIEKNQTIELDMCLKVPENLAQKLNPETHAKTRITGKGWHTVFLNWRNFEINEAQRVGMLRAVKEITIKLTSATIGEVRIKKIGLSKGNQISMQCDIKGKSALKGKTATYELEVSNSSDQKQALYLTSDRRGWESMITTVMPDNFDLNPGETRICQVQVQVPELFPEGSREKQTIRAISNGVEVSSITLVTASALPRPNILHTALQWLEVKDHVSKYDWAKKGLQEYEELARKWVVPEVASKITDDNTDKGMQLFQTQEEFNFMAAGISYQLTGKKEYAEKVGLYLRRLSDPVTGYPSTFRACHQSFVQEGHFFQHTVMAYDMIANAGILTEQDIKNIEHTFRLFYQTVDLGMHIGGINNWNLSEETGALYCALALQDWDLVEKMFYGTTGIVDHLSQGVMSDGWWYECTIGYNVWCASEFSQIALALEPWGLNFKDMKVPSGTTKHYSLMPEMAHPGLYGMNFEKWGSINNNSISIRDMWNAIPNFADYRGVMFGVNDAQETLVSGQPYELAYYLFRDPEYAAIIRRGTSRDLLYGIPELTESVSVLQTKSAFADNMGIVMLRSQTNNRPIREQIQASLHYGTFGGYHGHFDRTNLLNLSRYGRSFYNPEIVWYGYPSYMYKFYVQTSLSKNMVVVDQKMQEPVESFRILYYTGKMMQATAVQTNARWSNPPYGGMMYDWAGKISFSEKALQEGRSIPIPLNAPEYGSITGYTEPVLQRRLMVMMDDYVVINDYMKAEKEHTFDWLFQMKGFTGLTASKKEFLRHDDQMNTDPVGSAQFITDCNWWKTTGAAKAEFSMCWGKDCDNAGTRVPNSEDGVLKINVTTAWPLNTEIMVATTPESHDVQKQVTYKIYSDGKLLTSGETGTWILGQVNIDIPVTSTTELKLEASSKLSKTSTLFWADARVVLANGKEIRLSELAIKTSNIKPILHKGMDYYGGPVKIGGHEYTDVIAANPENADESGTTTVNLSGLNAIRFKAVLGGDYPMGDEQARHKTYSVRMKGKTVRYLSVIEPFENKSSIQSIEALDANRLKVTLKDGRVQELTMENMEGDGTDIKVSVVEMLNGKVLRKESNLHLY